MHAHCIRNATPISELRFYDLQQFFCKRANAKSPIDCRLIMKCRPVSNEVFWRAACEVSYSVKGTGRFVGNGEMPQNGLIANIWIDDEEEQIATTILDSTLRARHRIKMEWPAWNEWNILSDVKVVLNGKPYTPNWTKKSIKIGDREFIESASFEVEP